MFVRVRLKPVRLRTEARFAAPDPWHGDQRAEWSVEGYAVVPEHWQGAPAGALRKPAVRLAIRSEIDGVERFLPDSLGHLARTRGVAPAALPCLLAELEPNLDGNDWRPMLHLNVRRNVLVFGLVSLVCLLGFAALKATALEPPPIGDRGPFYRMVLLTFGAAGLLSTLGSGPVALARLRRREAQMAWAIERAHQVHG